MKDTLDKTNSDFLTGNVIRFNSEKEFPSSLHQKIFSEDILETTIKNNPELINDTIACNKMYRKTFWDKHDFKFPEDMLFEDIPVTIPSHLSAKSVDVLTMYTYRWRARDFGAASITQQRSEFKNMHDRMKALNMVSEFITTENLNKEIKNQFDLKSLLLDIPIYMNVLLDGDEMFQAYFLESVKSYLENVDCELFKDLRVSNRIKYCLIQQNKKKELLDFLEYYKTLGYLEKPTLINENYYYDYRYKEYLPDELKCAEVEFEPVTRIEEVNWEKKKLNISGYLYIKELDIPKKKSVKMDFYFVDASGKEIQNITKYSKQTRRPDVTAARGIEGNYKLPLKRVYNYNWSGFKLEIDIDNIINDIVNLEQVFIKVVITIGNVVRTKQLSTSRGYKARPKYRMFNDCMIYPKYDSLSNLFLETSKVSGLVNDVQIVGNELIFTIDSNSAETDKLKIGLVNYELKNVQYANLILNNKTHITASFDVSKIKWTEDGNSFYGYIYIGQKKQPLIFDRKLIDKQIYYNQNEMFLLNHGAKGNMGIFVQKITPFMKKVELKTKKVKLVVEILKTIKAPLQSYQLIIKIGDVSKKIEPILMEHNNIINLTYYFNLEDCEKLLLDSGAARIYVEYNCEELPIKITKEGFDNLNIIVKPE